MSFEEKRLMLLQAELRVLSVEESDNSILLNLGPTTSVTLIAISVYA